MKRQDVRVVGVFGHFEDHWMSQVEIKMVDLRRQIKAKELTAVCSMFQEIDLWTIIIRSAQFIVGQMLGLI